MSIFGLLVSISLITLVCIGLLLHSVILDNRIEFLERYNERLRRENAELFDLARPDLSDKARRPYVLGGSQHVDINHGY